MNAIFQMTVIFQITANMAFQKEQPEIDLTMCHVIEGDNLVSFPVLLY